MAERHLRGRPAAPGLADGRVVVLDRAGPAARRAGTAAEEAARLDQALAASMAEIDALARRTGGDAAAMLEFQSAMLADDELSRPAREAVAAGSPAETAWTSALGAEIALYAASGDEYFAARTADLVDMRDRVLGHLAGGAAAADVPHGAVVMATDLPLSRFLSVDWSAGGAIVLTEGSGASHVAMLARARGIPMVVGAGGADSHAAAQALVNGGTGEIVLDPEPATIAAFAHARQADAAMAAAAAAWLTRPAHTADGTPIAVHLNIGDPRELDDLDPACCSGIGLVRTELLFYGDRLPDEEAQYRVYRRIAEWAQGRPVTIRTLDAGGDKPLPGLAVEKESNPFLGSRGIRLSLRHVAVFQVQLRALARAAVHGAVRIMLPMVTIPDELEQARHLLDQAVATLGHEGLPARCPPLGIMVEVPAAAIGVARFDAAFFSIGSNDLTQYVTAAGRDIGAVAELADPLNPAVLTLIGQVARHGAATGRDVSLCGDVGAEPAAVPHLLRAGLRSLSVAPSGLARAKQAIAGVDLHDE